MFIISDVCHDLSSEFLFAGSFTSSILRSGHGDPGSVPIYKNGEAVGGVGIEGDGVYTADRDPADFDQPFEEVIAAAAARGFEAPSLIRGDNILVNGIRLAYLNVINAPNPATIAFGSLPGAVDPLFPIRGAQPSAFTPAAFAERT